MLIKDSPHYQLRATIVEHGRDQHSVILAQHWPKSNNPHWRTVLQVILTKQEVAKLIKHLEATCA